MVSAKQRKQIKKQQLLDLYNSGYYNKKQILSRLQIKERWFYKLVKELNKDGWEIDVKKLSAKTGGVVQEKTVLNKHFWRYHALQFEIKPYYFYPRYEKIRKEKGNYSIPFGKWLIILYSNKIIMYAAAGAEFKDRDCNKSMSKAAEDFNKTLFNVSNRFGFEVWKNQKANIKLLKHHLAYTDAPEFNSITKEKAFLTFRNKENKIFLQYDKSKGIEEREYVHLDLEKHKERIEKQFNDMIEYDPKTNTEIEKLMTKQTLFSLQTQMQLSNVVKIMHANLRLQGDMLELIRNTFKESNQEIKKSKSKIKQKPPTYIG